MDFTYINRHILDNLFYMLVSLLLFYALINYKEQLTVYKKTLITVCASIPIVLCMSFPIYVDQYCVHDFRQIPFFLGILYGGSPVAVALVTILLVARSIMHGFNLLTLIVYVIVGIGTALFSRKFNTLSRRNKIWSAMLLFVVLEIFTTYVALAMSDVFQVTDAYIFYFVILPPLVLFFGVYTIEILQDTLHMKRKVMKLEKMEVVSQLAASISHEVRNPLTVVKGFMQLLNSSDLSQASREQYIGHMSRELERAEAIINDYLAFAKPGTDKLENIQVEYEIKQAIEILTPLASMSSVHISDQLVAGTIVGNVPYFQQCLVNILKNGIESMPRGGELQVTSWKAAAHITIEVKDNGIGMSKEQINRFGEPYYSSKEKGTGLGSMVIVRTVQMMHGTLHIESSKGEGTTMQLSFPLAQQ